MSRIDQEFDLLWDSPEKLKNIKSDIKRARANGQLEINDKGRICLTGAAGFDFGGVFHSWIKRHDKVQQAIEDGDPALETWVREEVRRNGDLASHRGFAEVMYSDDHNKIPYDAIEFILDLCLHTQTKINTWYHGPFISNWTPVNTAVGDWGKVSGGLATELAATQYDEGVSGNRVAATFATASSSRSISHSAVSVLTISTGESGITLYGSTLNQSDTIAETTASYILFAATTFGSAKSGLGAADVINLGYTLSGTSTY